MGLILGSNLAFARLVNNMSLEELANMVGCSKQYLNQIEKKIYIDNYNDEFIKKLSDILQVKEDFFVGNSLNTPVYDSFYFRSQKTTSEKSKNVIKTISYIISTFFSYIRDKYDIDTVNVKKIDHNCENDIEKISEQQRKELGLSIDTPINNMMLEMERMGFKIIEYNNDTINNKIDACFSDTEEKVILINLKKINSSCRYRFSLAHELGHALLHLSNEEDESGKIEDEANYFASCFLLPRAGFLKEFNFLNKLRIDWNLLYKQKERWKVSIQAILRRALGLGIIDNNKYTTAMITLAKRGEKLIEPGDDTIPPEEPNIIKQYETLLQEDYYIVDSFLKKYCLKLDLLNRILNFNLVERKIDNICYINITKK